MNDLFNADWHRITRMTLHKIERNNLEDDAQSMSVVPVRERADRKTSIPARAISVASRAYVMPRRGLSRLEAALYIGVSPSKFDEMVKDGRMCPPKRIDGRVVWDIRNSMQRSTIYPPMAMRIRGTTPNPGIPDGADQA